MIGANLNPLFPKRSSRWFGFDNGRVLVVCGYVVGRGHSFVESSLTRPLAHASLAFSDGRLDFIREARIAACISNNSLVRIVSNIRDLLRKWLIDRTQVQGVVRSVRDGQRMDEYSKRALDEKSEGQMHAK